MNGGAAAIIFHPDPRAVDAQLTRLFASAGRTRALKPEPRQFDVLDPMFTADGEGSPTWGAAVVPSEAACLVVTAPPFLMVEEVAPGLVRLQALARALEADCAFIGVADGRVSIVEATADGRIAATGAGEASRPFAVGDVAISRDALEPRFQLCPVPPAVNEALRSLRSAEAFAEAIRLLVPGSPSVELVPQTLAAHRRVPRPGARTLYFRRRPEPVVDVGSLTLQISPVTVTTGEALELSEPGGGRARFVRSEVMAQVLADHQHDDLGDLDRTAHLTRWEGFFLASTPEEGAGLLSQVAEWLELPMPAVPEHGVTHAIWGTLARLPGAPRRPGVTTEVLTLGERKPVSVLVHRAARGGHAELELNPPSQAQRLLDALTPPLVGVHGRPAPVKRLRYVPLAENTQVHAAAVQGGFVASRTRKASSALYAISAGGEVRELAEVPGLVTALATLGDGFAITVADPERARAGVRIRMSSPSRLLIGGARELPVRGSFGHTELVGSPDGRQIALSVEGPAGTGQTVVLDVETGEELARAPELVNAKPAAWDERGLLLRGRDRRTSADRWFLWPLPGEVRHTDAPAPGVDLPLGALVRRGTLLAALTGPFDERGALYDTATGTLTDLFPVDGIRILAFGPEHLLACNTYEQLYLALTPR